MTARRPTRHDPAFPNVAIVARREYGELVRGRLFKVSTLVLVGLALFVALLPIVVRIVQREQSTQVAVVASEPELADRTINTIGGLLDQAGDRTYRLIRMTDAGDAIAQVDDRRLDAAVVVVRKPAGGLDFTFHIGETVGQAEFEQLSIAVFGVAILDYAAQNPVSGFELPTIQQVRSFAGGGGGGAPFDPAAFASRLIVGAVFGFLIFISIVIYGMWVAQGVVAEKMSRVMELLVSAASARQLVIGKALGIGMAGGTQTLFVLVPALAVLAIEDVIARAILGQGVGIASSLTALSPGLVLGFAAYYLLGFALYSLVYAAAGSLVSRAEDLQIIALPLSLIAIVGYFQGILALTGGITGFIRVASYVPFWSPFVMVTRLAVGRVDPWELVLSLGLLAATIVVVGVIAIRVYAAGVLLYGQRPGLRAYVAAARGR